MQLDKHIRVERFTNPYKKKMFGITFVVDEGSCDNYRGWSIKKAKKVAKMFRKLAKKLEKL
jgi:hypothetical protein